MADDINDGGPAFPQSATFVDRSCTTGGMSLRDWFAGQAMSGIIAYGGGPSSMAAAFADQAYAYADAMLAARVEDR